jgi:predicted ATPase
MRITRLVAGLPLGIELAAGWIHTHACDEIASVIEQRAVLPETGSIERPERQQSLRAVFASSWNLLSAPKQQALRRLAVFEGSFTREAAEHVCSELKIENEKLRNNAEGLLLLNSQFSIYSLRW